MYITVVRSSRVIKCPVGNWQLICFFFPLAFKSDEVFRINLLNPSGQACSDAVSCAGILTFADGTALPADASWDAEVTFQVLASDLCFQLSSSFTIAGTNCNEWYMPICVYDCDKGTHLVSS